MFFSYEIETEDLYDDIYRNKKLYDFSDYKDDHLYYINNNLAVNKSNKKIIGKFKDEIEGIPIIEFIGLKSKMYSIKLFNDKEKKRAKRIKSIVVKHDINHENYKNVVESGIKEYSLRNSIISKLHSLYIYTFK